MRCTANCFCKLNRLFPHQKLPERLQMVPRKMYTETTLNVTHQPAAAEGEGRLTGQARVPHGHGLGPPFLGGPPHRHFQSGFAFRCSLMRGQLLRYLEDTDSQRGGSATNQWEFLQDPASTVQGRIRAPWAAMRASPLPNALPLNCCVLGCIICRKNSCS